jgi:hypothetical protein
MGGREESEDEGTETGRKGRDKGGKWGMRMEQDNHISGLHELAKDALGRCGAATIQMLIDVVKRYVGHLVYSAHSCAKSPTQG